MAFVLRKVFVIAGHQHRKQNENCSFEFQAIAIANYGENLDLCAYFEEFVRPKRVGSARKPNIKYPTKFKP